MENIEQDYERRNAPIILNINGYDLTYKDPPVKGNIYRYRVGFNIL
jgi:hypothetical protein